MVKLRTATAADCEEIYRIQMAAVRSLPGGSQGKAGIEKWLAGQQPSVYVSSMAEESFVIAEDDGIVGWGALSVPKQEITNVFVDPAFHRQHIGSAILAMLESLAGKTGMDVVQLQATGTAIDFYSANGYRADPPVAPGADWALMKKRLA
ncbi:MAG: GNAT family N-acetyltransferase [Gammaproteobacteria bacterium]|jgi:putative acetyltransferase|nr:GNAT family N-acetyltransferase [Gammaproteobacteria bacterium]MDP7154104.1 GNAT family N-acetyltransferase [Gammaproteobacteria bacterium]MDP7296179.1 GNAT family N-acetyltransferase [Gammaproteobacteria bacterium]MDP7418809.1 GNAT family N-acetyltransferase [Gammaproteobacteria bacterium]MDP7660006.1 GNAT family N-acetyltransferase [Gammaproteobacteria bacterium]